MGAGGASSDEFTVDIKPVKRIRRNVYFKSATYRFKFAPEKGISIALWRVTSFTPNPLSVPVFL
jgi:hypothetical protein